MMKKIFAAAVLAALVSVGVVGCNDFFDKIPGKSFTLKDTFTDRRKTEQFLNNVYTHLPDDVTGERYYYNTSDRYGGIWMSASMEAHINWDWHNSHKWNLGSTSASDEYITFWWGHYYKGIAKASTFIQNIWMNDQIPEPEKEKYKAEARALRAIYYFFILRQYGPCVLLGEQPVAIDAPLSQLLKARSTVDECVKYIVDELDAAAPLLANKIGPSTNYGRMDRGQCKAYKAKVLLYAASPLFNGCRLMSGVKNPDGTHLFPQSPDPAKWEKAKNAFEEFLTEFVPTFYDLHIVKTSGGKTDFYESYRQATQGNYIDSKENISAKLVDHGDLNYAVTPQHHGFGGDVPKGGLGFCASQELVDMFFTDKGLRTVDDPDYKDYGIEVNPGESYYGSEDDYNDPVVPSRNYFKANAKATLKQWAHREARFYVCVTYNGSTWLNTGTNAGEVTTELDANGNSGFNKSAHDAPYTGYGWRKTARDGSEKGGDRHISCNLRLADIYLGYAEVLNECGGSANALKALEYVNKVRARAGIPEYGTGTDGNGLARIAVNMDDKDGVRRLIHRERLVELALEANHFFDVRRWMVADMKTGDDWIYPAYHQGGEGGGFHGLSYRENTPGFFRKTTLETRVFTPRQYFMPIPDKEVRRNDKMVQNYGWQSSVN